MNSRMIVIIMAVVFALAATAAFAAGDAAKGKALFGDAKFAGGSKACSTCHPNGKGLENAGDKKEFHIMGKSQKSLEEAVNACIVNANRGKAIDVKSKEMMDIVSFIKSLKPAKKSSSGY